MNQDLVQEINRMHAEFCAGLADPSRLMILYTLSDRPSNVTELSNYLNISQPTVSRHLKILRDRGLVLANREGQSVVYTLSDRRVIQALDLLRSVMASKLKDQADLANSVDSFDENH
jgi:DNA-binding transcriptional ArsR family regulator